MSADRWTLVKKHLAAVLDLARKDRVAYLDRHCAGDQALRTEIEAYLEEEDEVTGFMESPVADLVTKRRRRSSRGPFEES